MSSLGLREIGVGELWVVREHDGMEGDKVGFVKKGSGETAEVRQGKVFRGGVSQKYGWA